MKLINYRKLYKYFIEEMGLTPKESFRNIWRVGNLPKAFKDVIYFILEEQPEGYRKFAVDGITLKQLVVEEKMKLVQAVFFLDWVRREPKNAFSFMSSKRLKSPVEISDDDVNELKEAYERNIKGKVVRTPLVPEDNSGRNIEVEAVSENEGVMAVDYADIISDQHMSEHLVSSAQTENNTDNEIK